MMTKTENKILDIVDDDIRIVLISLPLSISLWALV